MKTKATDRKDAGISVAVSSDAVSGLIHASYRLARRIMHLFQGLLGAAVGYSGQWRREPGREMAQGQTSAGLVEPSYNSIRQTVYSYSNKMGR